MFLKIIATITIVVPLGKGLSKIWNNKRTGIPAKIFQTLTVLLPLATGMHQTWKKK